MACFNPRARVGRDLIGQKAILEINQFQSTRPRGARHDFRQALEAETRFQSTRPRGARQSLPLR